MVIEERVQQTVATKQAMQNNVSVRLLILNRKNFSFDGVRPVCDIVCYGKTIKEWVVASAGSFACSVIEYGLTDNILDLVKPHLQSEQVTIVLYGETPLIRHTTLVDLVNDFINKNQKVRRFKRGYVFDTEYIKSTESICAPELGEESGEDYLAITNNFDLNNAMQILKRRIMSYHIANGVNIVDTFSTYIEAEVEIEAGVTIYPNNSILGTTKIQKGAILYPANVIENCIIGSNAVLKGVNLENVKVNDNAVITKQ